ncbi:hypothetical protein A6J40_11995 [Legionella longbeachae]|uniref:hypothetical protein n=1 Tax=Legionella longbeachae TaxID=450 RepID=UPI0009B7737F|nr:hypothetical protein [Legionella longbeachae]ARB92853.1 hypothetical protein A6J40_11995 [Legionella longbeachae]RZV26503.1 hypothetical protein EKG34_05020 [Legionella longbeachae]UAK47258.1 hypothetical protein K8O86_03440 [Legionella longbeachae]VEE04324.1 Uncharacterised protein [Legionella oakridgensis]
MKSINADVEAQANARVYAVRDKFSPGSNFDLLGNLLEHSKQVERNHALSKVFLDLGDDLALLKKELDSEVASLSRLEKLSSFTKNSLDIAEKITYKQKCIVELTTHLQNLSTAIRKRKRYPRSDAKHHIRRLAGIFYEMTGKKPDCIYDSMGGEYGNKPYSGVFYDFLLSIKAISNEIGIKLPESNETLGKYASQIIHEDSFASWNLA